MSKQVYFVTSTETARWKHKKGQEEMKGKKLSQTVRTNLQRGLSISVISTVNLIHGDSVSLIPRFILGRLWLPVRERHLNST